MPIEIQNLVCRYGQTPAVDGVDLTIEDGEFLALLGPSGSGKTTLLRLLAGLETPESGALLFDGRDAATIAPNRRNIGFVFQHYALFKHMTVARNIGFGLAIRPRAARPTKQQIAKKVDELLDLVQLPGLGGRYPNALSGGQRQRVALARALAIEPKLLLLDEPFGALDAQVRTELRLWLKDLHRRLGITSVFVTHDQEEALELADRVIVLRKGKIEQIGTPQAVYRDPKTAFVYGFLGQANQLPCTVANGVARTGDGCILAQDLAVPDGPADAWFRPHEIDLVAPDLAKTTLSGRVADVTTVGPRTRLAFHHGTTLLMAELSPDQGHGLEPGKPLYWRPTRVHIFAR